MFLSFMIIDALEKKGSKLFANKIYSQSYLSIVEVNTFTKSGHWETICKCSHCDRRLNKLNLSI